MALEPMFAFPSPKSFIGIITNAPKFIEAVVTESINIFEWVKTLGIKLGPKYNSSYVDYN